MLTFALQVYNDTLHVLSSFAAGTCVRPALYRPPYGASTTLVAQMHRNMGMRGVIWNLDTLDWMMGDSRPVEMYQRFRKSFSTTLASSPSRSIIHLQHESMRSSAASIVEFVSIVRELGFDLVSLDRCVWGPEYDKVSVVTLG